MDVTDWFSSNCHSHRLSQLLHESTFVCTNKINLSVKQIFCVNFTSLCVICSNYYYHAHAMKFLFRNNNFTLDFTYIAMARENKFVKITLQKGESDLREGEKYDQQKGLI